MTVVQRLVYVSGAPGAGKSTLAEPLAAELGYALLAKDTIKETLHGVLGPPALDRARSRELGAASMELLWALAARSPHVVIEANFRPYSDYERSRLTDLGGVQVEVHCTCAAELAVARYNSRPRHPVHVQETITPDYLTEFDRPVGIGALITVDTSAPVNVPSLATQVRSLLLSRKRAGLASPGPGRASGSDQRRRRPRSLLLPQLRRQFRSRRPRRHCVPFDSAQRAETVIVDR